VRKLQLCVVALAAALLMATAPSAASASCTPGWRVFKTVSGAQLSSVSFVPGTSQAWAVGRYGDSEPLAMRFDGRRWSEVPLPAPAGQVQLLSVSARSASDAWAVGSYIGEQAQLGRTLAMHWNGTEWSVVPSPNPQFMARHDSAKLWDVVALGRDDVWAVGSVSTEGATPSTSTLAMHWDGTSWKIVPTEALEASPGQLLAVSPVPRFETLWAVGSGTGALIAAHRNDRWEQIAAPGAAGLHDVTALAWDDVWAVGDSLGDGSALILHRSGKRWQVVLSPPSPVPGGAFLAAVSAVSAADLWAVGHMGASGSSAGRRPLMEHWDGSRWSLVPAPIADANGQLTDVTMRRSGWGWSVGHVGTGDGVILRHCPA
jgi:hypothetical protein